MGILFIFLSVIALIILIARFGSKLRPASELGDIKKKGLYSVKKIEPENHQAEVLEALISLLIQKEIFSEEEVFLEVKSILEKKNSSKERGVQNSEKIVG